ncbi:MAG: GumC family protein [Vicinamibacterales bacterium]
MSDEHQHDSQGPPARLNLDLEPAGESIQAATPASSPTAPAATYGVSVGAGYGRPFGDEFHITDYLRILYKRRWVAAAAFCLVFGFAAVRTFTATPVYQARVQLLIENENPNVVNFEEVLTQNQRALDYLQTQYRMLQSRALARRTLDAESLWNDPLFTGAGAVGFNLNPVAWARTSVAWAMSLVAGDPEAELPGADETAAQSRAIDAFLRRLSVMPVRNSRLVDVGFSSPDAALSARVVNALARAYIEQSIEFRFTATREATDFLEQQMAAQRKTVEASEQALQRYREQTDSVSLEDRQNIVVQRLADLNAAVTRARTERIQKEAAYDQIRAIQSDPAALDSAPSVLGNAFVQQLKGQLSQLQRERAQLAEKLGARHPDMIRISTAIETTQIRLDGEITKVVQAIRAEYESALAQERSLNASLEQQKSEALALNRQSIEYGVLEREAESNRQMYDGLMQRSRQTGISGELRTSNIRVVDPAEPPRRPSSPNKTLDLLLGLLGGSTLGVLLAFGFEYLDSRIKSPEEIKVHLGLPFLGLVPAVGTRTPDELLVNNGVPSHFAEAFRSIRTNVLFSSADAGSKSLVITSTAPGEGKTLVSSNLAVSLAMAGQRVLLIDADMRRPKAHEMFSLPLEPGLSNVLVGGAKASEAVRKTAVAGLWVLCAGKHPPNPAELLGSQRLRDFLVSLRAHFDWVVLDSPPVMAVTDAALVSHFANGVVFVVGSEMTSRGVAKAALEQLDSAKAKYVGAILNNVDLQRHGYYYSRYYQSSYKNYYASPSA